ncbi:MAG TPA: hypothetical protein VE869_01660 [Gemmatimonas sp.]|nr:hypothetical protein [Gemmatimonas sp.]
MNIAGLLRAAVCALPATLIGSFSSNAGAQPAPKIPIRTLAPSTAVSKDSVGPVLAVRALPDGNVMVNDPANRRVVLFDNKLATQKVVIDTIGGTEPDAAAKVVQWANTLIPYGPDSSLYVDRATQSLMVIDARGKVARMMSLPRPGDFVTIGAGGEAGHPGFDSKGRFVYHGLPIRPRPQPDAERPWLPPIPVQVDSAPIVRADLDTRKIDTLTSVKLNIGAPYKKLEVDAEGNAIMRMYVNPLGVDDPWALLSDGTIAVLSVHDYHINWVDPDGTRRSTPKMPFDWKRITDTDRQRIIDSLAPQLERMNNVAPRTMNTPSGPRTAKQQFEFLPPEKFGDYEQPIQTGAMKADLDNRLWIVPRTSLSAKGGLLYDVINRKGEIVERVQFPGGYVLAGFGESGVLYVVRLNGQKGILERTTVK